MKRKILFIIIIFNVLFIRGLHSQSYTSIPDIKFEQALIDLSIDSGIPDGKVRTQNINNLTSLVINNRNIKVLTGIEGFVHLTSLNCSGNLLTGLDLTSNSDITQLNCSSNQLNSLILNLNSNLITLLCASNQLKTLDLSTNTKVTFIDCSDNQLTSLNVSGNRLLTYLTCSSNQLSSLSVTLNDSLTIFSCANNRLLSINISKNLILENLICSSNQLTTLDISKNQLLTTLELSNNLIKGLDISSNKEVTSLNCSSNQLENLNIKNGRNSILTVFNSTVNPNLRCIRVDDPVAANSFTGWLKDITANYNLECHPFTYVPDNAFEQALIDLGFDSGTLDDYVSTASIDTIKHLNISGKIIKNLTGLEDFIALDSLNCSHNLLTNLDMSKHLNLAWLDCDTNKLRALSLKNLPDGVLNYMNARGNPLLTCISVDDVAGATGELKWFKDATASYNLNCNSGKTYVPDNNFEQALIDLGYDFGSLDNYVTTDSIKTIRILDVHGKNIFDLKGIEGFVALDSLDCSANKLSSIDVSKNTSLLNLSCFSNFLTNLDVLKDTLLTKLNCGDNKLSSLDVTKNIKLLQLVCNSNDLTQLNVSKNIELVDLNCSSNHITSTGLDLSKNTSLVQLFCSDNVLSTIDVTKNAKLKIFICGSNNLSGLDLSKDTLLTRLDCSRNNLTILDLSENVLLTDVNCNSNQISNLSFVNNTFLRKLSSDNNQLTSINITSNDSLRSISVISNKLPDINVSNSQVLQTLNCSGNQLAALDVNNNDSLRFLSCENNKISGLLLDKNLKLRNLDCDNNQISSLNIGANNLLSELSIANNKLSSLDISTNLSLLELSVDNNQLLVLNTGSNNLLRKLSCSLNQLKTLNLSNNTSLTSLMSSSNQLISLNVKNGNNSNLILFNVTANPYLTCIEVDSPAQAAGFPGWTKDATASYSINCRYNDTYVPDDNFEQALIALGFDSGVKDDYVRTASIDTITYLNISGNNITDLKGIEDFDDLRSLNCSSNLIDSLALGKNTALTILVCGNNLLDNLDVSKNILLEELNFSSNNITKIDVKKLISLKRLICNSNKLSGLDLKYNVALTFFSCTSNMLSSLNVRNGNNAILTSFNVTGNPALTCLEVDNPIAANLASGWFKDATASYSSNCHYNQTYVPDDAFEQALKDLGYDFSATDPLDDYVPTAKIRSIISLNISNRGITDLTGIQDCINLVSLDCSNNIISDLDLSGNILLTDLNCSGNALNDLNILANTVLARLNFANNGLSVIDLSTNTGLTEVYCFSNQLTSLNITQNHNLIRLSSHSNKLISVDLNNGNNLTLLSFDITNNTNLSCILVDNVSAAEGYTNWYKDPWARYRIECNDDDNDGVPDSDDTCPTTPFGDIVDLFGCSFFTLPSNNFSILSTQETCRSSNNGKISIAAYETHNYNATLKGGEINNSYNFTNNLEIRNLRSGTYELCLTLPEKPGYKNCFDMIIKEPEDLNVLSFFNSFDETVSLKMSGGTDYFIDMNGSIFKTSESDIVLNLEKGNNTIVVKTEADCQGIHKESFFLPNSMVIYPNPFEDQINIYLGNVDSKEVSINIYSWTGQLVISKIFPVQNGLVVIDASQLVSGIYILSLKSGTLFSTFEIVKK